MIVVSETGEMLSPQTAPENMAPSSGHKRGSSDRVVYALFVERETSIGIAMGTKRAIVPHDDPVNIAEITAVIKKIAGKKF